MDLLLNNIQRLTCHKTKATKQTTNQLYYYGFYIIIIIFVTSVGGFYLSLTDSYPSRLLL